MKRLLKAIGRHGTAVFFLAAAVTVLIWSLGGSAAPAPWEADFLDVGQGDSLLVKTPAGRLILIDGGPDNRVLRRLAEVLPFYRRAIDYLVVSHFHEDHVAGLVEIVRRYKVAHVILPAEEAGNPTALEFLSAANDHGAQIQPLAARVRLVYPEGCVLDLLNPVSLGVKADANNSLVCHLDCLGYRILAGGDNSAAVEKVLSGSGWDLSADILKASHHGSGGSNSDLYLKAVHPKILVIPVGADNKFGHPSADVLTRAEDLGIEVLRTDRSGTIRISSP